MVRFVSILLSLLSAQAIGAFAQFDDPAEEVQDPTTSPQLAVSVSASFPAAEIFGVKLVNGKPTQALVSFTNDEPGPITVNFIGGSLWTPDFEGSQLIRNLTTARYNIEIPAGEKQSVDYSFQTELHPQDLRLNIATVLSDEKGAYYSLVVYNETVSIVEQDTSIFDPQIIFLYLFILACFVGVIYFFYTIWIAPYFPQKRPSKGGERAKKTPGGLKRNDPADTVAVGSPEPSASTSGAKYNEEWIPAHHIQRPEARRVKSGGPKPKSRSKAE